MSRKLILYVVLITVLSSALSAMVTAVSMEIKHRVEVNDAIQRSLRETKNLLNDCELNGSQFVESNEMQMYARNSK